MKQAEGNKEIEEMTKQELVKAKAYFFNVINWDAITQENGPQLVAHYEQKVTDAQKKVDNAVKFRPSYAPRGQETRSEKSAKGMLFQAQDELEKITAIVATITA